MKAICTGLIAGTVCYMFILQLQAVSANPSSERVLYSFCPKGGFHCSDGASPESSLINVNGTLYGTTYGGGNSESGVIFALRAGTDREDVLHSFGDGNDGLNPMGGVIYVKGSLYGTAYSGGGHGAGALFALDLTTDAEATEYGFCGEEFCLDGEGPEGGLIKTKGTLYGMTSAGGAVGKGTIFSYDMKTGTETVILSFVGRNGSDPQAGLLDVDGRLYGTTSGGGTHGCGTVFSFDPDAGETVLHSFGCGTDGAFPKSGLIEVNGTLYGTAWSGGVRGCASGTGCGTVFSVNASTGAEAVLHAFDNTDGQWPTAGLIDVKGVLYGTTSFGGAYTSCGDGAGCGTVFAIDPHTGQETVVYSFGGTDGATPVGGLINVNGLLYGTTSAGGAYGYGTVFMLIPVAPA